MTYKDLIPLYANSFMRITTKPKEKQLHFSNIISYFYLDKHTNSKFIGYMDYLDDPNNFNQEINIYWQNLQSFLDKEENIINEKKVKLEVINVSINFLDEDHPIVEWIVEFSGPLEDGLNLYENKIEKEVLEYPINSQYIFEPSLSIQKVTSDLNFVIQSNNRIIEYSGYKGNKLGGYESIHFSYIK